MDVQTPANVNENDIFAIVLHGLRSPEAIKAVLQACVTKLTPSKYELIYPGVFMENNNLAVSMKLGMRRLASGVCVVSTKLTNNLRFAMTVSSVTSVSDTPASLLVCINQLVSQQGHLATKGSPFAVNVLSSTHQDVSNICAGRDPARDRFEIGNWVEDETGLPVLGDSPAVFVCQTDQVMTYGTHKIIVGAIQKVILTGETVEPLLYADGSYGAFVRQ